MNKYSMLLPIVYPVVYLNWSFWLAGKRVLAKIGLTEYTDYAKKEWIAMYGFAGSSQSCFELGYKTKLAITYNKLNVAQTYLNIIINYFFKHKKSKFLIIIDPIIVKKARK